MSSMIGKRIFFFFTPDELARTLPINEGVPLSEEAGFYTVLGEVTEECTAGAWLRLEKLFDPRDVDLKAPFQDDVYLIAWSSMHRAILAKRDQSELPGKPMGFR